MNLHAIVAPYVAEINPWLTVTIQSSTGYTTAADGSRTPTYTTTTEQAQIQALTYQDLQHLDSLNIAGVRRAAYITGNYEGLVRDLGKGGDLVTFEDGSVWLIAYVLENWTPQDGWVKVVLTLQNGS